MSDLQINKTVPSLVLDGTNGSITIPSDVKGKKLIIYFYPKDSTPGCTNEGVAFTEAYSQFKDLNVEIYGVSRDSIKSHENFKKKYNFPFNLLSDPDELACNLFNVIKMKNMYGKEVRGIERSTFLINEKGELIKEWRAVKVNDHIQQILEFLKN
jgi:thioredoxin-dependent peroxiredoxin